MVLKAEDILGEIESGGYQGAVRNRAYVIVSPMSQGHGPPGCLGVRAN